MSKLFQICSVCGTQQEITNYDFCGACGHEWTREEIRSSTPVPVENASNTRLQSGGLAVDGVSVNLATWLRSGGSELLKFIARR